MEQFLCIDWERCHLSRAVNPIALSWFFTKKKECAPSICMNYYANIIIVTITSLRKSTRVSFGHYCERNEMENV